MMVIKNKWNKNKTFLILKKKKKERKFVAK